MKQLKVLELFAGTRSIGKAFEEKGHLVYSIEWDKQHENIDWYVDIGVITSKDILERFGRPDIIWLSPDCFTAGHLVKTSNGYKPIEKLNVGDFVLTHKNRYMPVYATMSKTVDQIRKIKISGCKEFEVTDEHPFLARKKIKKWNNKKRSYETVLGEVEWVKAKDLDNTYKVQKLINQNETIPSWKGVPHNIVNQNGINRTNIVNNLSVLMDNTNFWWLMGRYLGDGWYRADETKNRFDFAICCNKSEDNEIREKLDLLPFNYNYSEKYTTNVFSIHSKELAIFTSQFGKGSEGKFIPEFVLDLPIDLLKSFIDGYISADGSIYVDNKGRESINITTVSKSLAYGIQQILMKISKIHSSICYNSNPTNQIEGRTVNSKPTYIISFYPNGIGREYISEDDCIWVNVTKNEVVNVNTDVYNISVIGDETYTIENVTVHNCTSYSIAGISHHRKKDKDGNLTPISDYAKFCDKVNQHTLDLVKELNPTYYFIENPRGGLRKMNFMQELPRYTVTYCQYGDDRMKPTDIWTNHANPKFKPPCKNGDPCHTAAPRGSRTGTQGIKGSVDRSRIPKQLCEHIVDISEEMFGSECIQLDIIINEIIKIVQEESVLSGFQYIINYTYIENKFNIAINNNLREVIKTKLEEREEVADVYLDDNGFDVVLYTDYAPNYNEENNNE